ncbi:MAG: hypothetical protein JKY37_12470 [Nannocystaceae bacterium]|nr:hypothetical protein [Nannocystaceae bacterium]
MMEIVSQVTIAAQVGASSTSDAALVVRERTYLPSLSYDPRYQRALARSKRADADTLAILLGGAAGATASVVLLQGLAGTAPATASLGVAVGAGALIGAVLVARMMTKLRQ